jgi:hypothetical protein
MADYTAPMRFNSVAVAVVIAFLVGAATGQAQGTTPKEKPDSYYAHAALNDGLSIGADLLGRYLPVEGYSIYSDEYIYVEVALFGPKGRKIDLQSGQFVLNINKTPLTPQSPGLVTLTGNFPEMIARPQVVAGGGANGGVIEIGGRDRKPRFPGDDPAHTPTPGPEAPVDPSNGQVQKAPVKPEILVERAKLPEGSHALPVSGFLFFAYEGKLKKAKHIVLDYKGPLGSASVTLR